MIIKCLPVGPLAANCYIVGCEETRDALVIDPGGNADKIMEVLAEEQLKLKTIVNTHGHIDHIAANDQLRESTGANLMIHELDAEMLANPVLNLSEFMGAEVTFRPADRLLKEGDMIEIGHVKFEVLHTPGHTKGGMCLLTQGAVFTGDTLFNGSIGRTDFPGGDYKSIISSIKTKLMNLPDGTEVYPGHMGSSTIAYERLNNPYMR